MNGRIRSQGALRKTINVAVHEAVNAVSGATTGARLGAARGDSGAPAGTYTTEGTDGEGLPFTKHVFILDLDKLDDPGALLG